MLEPFHKQFFERGEIYEGLYFYMRHVWFKNGCCGNSSLTRAFWENELLKMTWCPNCGYCCIFTYGWSGRTTYEFHPSWVKVLED